MLSTSSPLYLPRFTHFDITPELSDEHENLMSITKIIPEHPTTDLIDVISTHDASGTSPLFNLIEYHIDFQCDSHEIIEYRLFDDKTLLYTAKKGRIYHIDGNDSSNVSSSSIVAKYDCHTFRTFTFADGIQAQLVFSKKQTYAGYTADLTLGQNTKLYFEDRYNSSRECYLHKTVFYADSFNVGFEDCVMMQFDNFLPYDYYSLALPTVHPLLCLICAMSIVSNQTKQARPPETFPDHKYLSYIKS